MVGGRNTELPTVSEEAPQVESGGGKIPQPPMRDVKAPGERAPPVMKPLKPPPPGKPFRPLPLKPPTVTTPSVGGASALMAEITSGQFKLKKVPPKEKSRQEIDGRLKSSLDSKSLLPTKAKMAPVLARGEEPKLELVRDRDWMIVRLFIIERSCRMIVFF